MFATGELNRCRARKAALLQASEENRRCLGQAALELRPAMDWVDRGLGYVRMATDVWSVVSPLLAFRRSRRG